MAQPQERITLLLNSVDPTAADELLPLVYDQLRSLARARLRREAPGQTLQATALVHEAFLRVRGADDPGWDGRRHFFVAAAEAMRRILIEQHRRKGRLRHGGDHARQPLEEDVSIEQPFPVDDLLALEEALQKLETADPRAREIVNCRYFVGMSDAETADALGLSLRTVERQWQFIRTFLQVELGGGPPA